MVRAVLSGTWSLACAALLAACGGERGGDAVPASARAAASTTAQAGASRGASVGDAGPAPSAGLASDAQAVGAASSTADAAIAISVPPGLDRYPALAEAVEARNDAHRQAFDAARAGARRSGADTSAWQLRIDWRGIAGNRYLRLMQGDGGMDTGAGPVPITERVTYEGIGKQVLALGDWFTDDAAAAAAVGERVAADAPEAAGTVDLSTVAYEPVFSADGPVMGFDLLLAPAAGAGAATTRRVRVPLAAVDALIDPAQRQALSAEAAGL